MTYPEPQPMPGNWPIVFDLDGTLAEPTWPSPTIGKMLPGANEMVLHYAKLGFELVIYTARPESHKAAIWAWLRLYGLDSVIYDVITDRPRAALYIDDRCWNPVDRMPEPVVEDEPVDEPVDEENTTYVG